MTLLLFELAAAATMISTRITIQANPTMIPASASPSPPCRAVRTADLRARHESEDDAHDAGHTEEQDAGAGADERYDREAVRLLGRGHAVRASAARSRTAGRGPRRTDRARPGYAGGPSATGLAGCHGPRAAGCGCLSLDCGRAGPQLGRVPLAVRCQPPSGTLGGVAHAVTVPVPSAPMPSAEGSIRGRPAGVGRRCGQCRHPDSRQKPRRARYPAVRTTSPEAGST